LGPMTVSMQAAGAAGAAGAATGGWGLLSVFFSSLPNILTSSGVDMGILQADSLRYE
jgi:hypothetical protein